MSVPFSKVKKSKLGYSPSQVEEFLQRARSSYDGTSAEDRVAHSDIRRAVFDLVKGGYTVTEVDEALDRLEQAFFRRGLSEQIASEGIEAVLQQHRDEVDEMTKRLERTPKKRFKRAGFLKIGYHRKEVSALADRLLAHFHGITPVKFQEIQQAAFRQQSNGYDEYQVDLVLDAAIEILHRAELLDQEKPSESGIGRA